MKALVTGGAGFIGGHLVDALLREGASVRVLDNFSTGKRENLAHNLKRIELIEADIREPDDCDRAAKGCDVIFHEAALPSVVRSVAEPAEANQVNVTGTVNVLEAARKNGVGRLVYAASSAAYGDTPTLPKTETMMPQPLSPYAVSKLAGENYLTVYAQLYGMKTCSLRYFNVFGPRQDPNSHYAAVMPRFITMMLAGKAPTIFGDGGQTRDFCYIDNVVQANLLAAKGDVKGEVVNVACGERVSLLDVVAIINEELGTKITALHEEGRAGDIRHSLADISAATALLGFDPKVDVREGLRRAIEHYRAL